MPHPQLMVEHSPAGFRWLRLARPERRNALDVALALAVRDTLREEPEVPVLLGSTDPHVFCAGADLTITHAERATISDLIYDCCETMLTRPGPVIAVVTGAAVGGGAQLAAASDLRIAGPRARLRWIGPPGLDLAVGAWLLPDLAGRGAAMELVLTGRWVEAAEALALGLVNRIEDDPARAAEQLAAGLATQQARSIPGVQGVQGGQAVQGVPGIREVQGGQAVQGVPGIREVQGGQAVEGVPGIREVQGGQGIEGVRSVQGVGAGVKAVMAAGGLLDRLRAEREVSRSAWARVTGVNPVGQRPR